MNKNMIDTMNPLLIDTFKRTYSMGVMKHSVTFATVRIGKFNFSLNKLKWSNRKREAKYRTYWSLIEIVKLSKTSPRSLDRKRVFTISRNDWNALKRFMGGDVRITKETPGPFGASEQIVIK